MLLSDILQQMIFNSFMWHMLQAIEHLAAKSDSWTQNAYT